MKVNTKQMLIQISTVAAQRTKPSTSGQQEDRFAAGRIENPGMRVTTDGPVGQIVRDLRRREEGTALLTKS